MLIMVILGIASAFIAETVVVMGYESRAISQRTVMLRNQCTVISNQMASLNYLNDTSNEVINGEINMLTNIYGGRILIVDKDYRVIKDSFNLDTGKFLISSRVNDCFKGEETSQYDEENEFIEMTIGISDPESIDKQIIGVMLLSVSTVEITASRRILENEGRLVLFIIVTAILIFGFILSGLLVKPFQKITTSIEGLGDGYLEENMEVNDLLETEKITNAFNRLLQRIRVLDESRQEFVSNVSHELKTPLASIKVLADSLNQTEGAPVEMYQEFMLDISEEIDRENQIITDLLTLVRMDKKAADLNIDSYNINDLLALVIKRLKPIGEKQRVELILDSFRPVNAEIDQTKMTLAFSNLIENAIKYNKPEGGWVRVSLNADQKYFYVTIADSGIGIPENAIDHIFERFYRVDKSHSREIGGTGLGLAITRGAIAMHRGAIKVYSKENEGTTFSIRIPLLYLA